MAIYRTIALLVLLFLGLSLSSCAEGEDGGENSTSFGVEGGYARFEIDASDIVITPNGSNSYTYSVSARIYYARGYQGIAKECTYDSPAYPTQRFIEYYQSRSGLYFTDVHYGSIGDLRVMQTYAANVYNEVAGTPSYLLNNRNYSFVSDNPITMLPIQPTIRGQVVKQGPAVLWIIDARSPAGIYIHHEGKMILFVKVP